MKVLGELLNKFVISPRNLHLIDGAGALVSGFFLSAVLPAYVNVFGIPKTTLYFLAIFPLVFALFDGFCYVTKNIDFRKSLKHIALLNSLYCLISLFAAIFHYRQITVLGWAYLLVEILLVVVLISVEVKVAKGSHQNT